MRKLLVTVAKNLSISEPSSEAPLLRVCLAVLFFRF